MSDNIEKKLGIPSFPPITEHKFTTQDPIIAEVAEIVCDVFSLNSEMNRTKFIEYVTESLNKEKGHPARLIFLRIIFKTMSEFMEQANVSKWRH